MMQTLKPGTIHPDVLELRSLLFRCGHWMPDAPQKDLYDERLKVVVRTYQQDERLIVDGIVGPKTWTSLQRDREQLPLSGYPATTREQRLSDACRLIIKADGGQGLRYARIKTTKGLQDERFGRRKAYIMPLVTVTDPAVQEPAHGATCGLFAHQFLTCYLAAIFEEHEIYPTWPTSQSGRWIWTLSVAGEWWKQTTTTNPDGTKVTKWRRSEQGKPGAELLRGYSEYVERRIDYPVNERNLAQLYCIVEKVPAFVLIEYPSHVGTAVRIDDKLKIVDPRTSLPARPGWYEVSSNGDRDPQMEQITFRRISEKSFPPKSACRRFKAIFFQDTSPQGYLATGLLKGSTGIKYYLEVE